MLRFEMIQAGFRTACRKLAGQPGMLGTSVWLLAAACILFASPAHPAIVFAHAAVAANGASVIHSNAVTSAEGNDSDVIAYDSFLLDKPVSVASVGWRGSSSNGSSSGFTIRIYASRAVPATRAEIAHPMAEVRVTGDAGEISVGNKLSDYCADIATPLLLAPGVQYWISVVSNRRDASAWGWANGIGGDDKSIQSWSEFKILSAPGDRSFSLNDAHACAGK